MARQPRSELTRRKLIGAAVDVFGEVGYAAAGRIAIIERAGVTKGALYHHFDSMDALVGAIIEEGCGTVLDAFASSCHRSSPALEGMIHGMFAAAEVVAGDKTARVATHLALALGEFHQAAAAVQTGWLRHLSAQTRRAISEGDLCDGLDAHAVGESLVGVLFGTWVSAHTTSGPDQVRRLTQLWELLLPAVVAPPALPYFREFLARETLRHRAGAAPDAG